VNVELAREAMDCVGVDAALVFARREYLKACVSRYPDRFAGALAFDWMLGRQSEGGPWGPTVSDLEEQVAEFCKTPGMLAARNSPGNADDSTLRLEFCEGRFEPLYVCAEKNGVPLFFSTHGHAGAMAQVAAAHPGLTMVIDHLGVSQSPVSPPRPDPWDQLSGLLSLAHFPNVYVKFSGAPVLSRTPYPHKDNWPYLHQVVNAFGPDRLMWGSDFTRLRRTPMIDGGGLAPRNQWHLYSDSVNYLRDTTELSASDKEKIFGGTIRAVLRWQKPESADEA
jgi:predicted TIM-barrel fold metal-dependent hydrolase